MIKINLLPKEARKRIGVTEQIVIIVLGLVLTFAGIGGAWGYLNDVIAKKQAQIEQTKQRLEELKKVIAEIEAFEKQRAALEQKLAIIAKLQKEQQLPVHLLDELYLTLEEDLWLQNFSYNGDSIMITGTALSDPVIADYMRSLEESQYFEGVELQFSRRNMIGKQEVREFQLSMKLTVPENLIPTPPPQ